EEQRRERERRWDSHDGVLPRSCFAAHRRADAAARQLGEALATLARSFYTRATNELARGDHETSRVRPARRHRPARIARARADRRAADEGPARSVRGADRALGHAARRARLG